MKLPRWSTLPLAVRLAVGVAALAVLVVIPLGLNNYWKFLAGLVVTYTIANLGFQAVVGWSGQLAMAHASFFGIGAYAAGFLPQVIEKTTFNPATGENVAERTWSGNVPFLIALLLVPPVCAAAGYVLGLPAIRLKGFYLAIATLAFAGMILRVFVEAKDYTKGGEGLSVDTFRLFGWDKALSSYYLALGIAAVVWVLLGRMKTTRFGRTLLAVRDTDIAASSLGVNVTQYRLASFAISAGLAALGGAMWGQAVGFIAPQAFTTALLNAMLMMIIVGGVGTRAGAAIGSVFYVAIDQFFANFPTFRDAALKGAYRNIAFGLALMICIGVLPDGLASLTNRLRSLRRPAASSDGPGAAPTTSGGAA